MQPWLGDRVAYFAVGGHGFGLVLETEDEKASETFAREVTAAGPHRASKVIDGQLVLASTGEVLRAAVNGESLADSTRLDVAGDDAKGAPNQLVAVERSDDLLPALRLLHLLPDRVPEIDLPILGDGPLTARAWEARDRSRLEISGLATPPESSPPLDGLPRDAWLAFASADIAGAISTLGRRPEYRRLERWTGLDLERDVLRHLGRGTFYLRSSTRSDIAGRLAAEVRDEQALRRATARARTR